MFVVFPISSSFTFDVGTAFATARVQPNGAGGEQASSVSGLTDTQIRANWSFGTDFVVLTAGLNIPTGRRRRRKPSSSLHSASATTSSLFPISNMGTGFGATAGIAIAPSAWRVEPRLRRQPATERLRMNRSSTTRARRPHFQPGNEYRARLGLDHRVRHGTLRHRLHILEIRQRQYRGLDLQHGRSIRRRRQASTTRSATGELCS